MKINGTIAKVYDYANRNEISYELETASSGKIYSIDRGVESDIQGCEFLFHGTREDISDIFDVFSSARSSGDQIEITECEERFFGWNVGTASVDCVVSKMGNVEVFSKNVYELKVSLLATDPVYTGTAGIPNAMRCEQISSSGGGDWNTSVNSSYFSENTFTDRGSDTLTFSGSYILSASELESFENFRKTNRGSVFQINELQFGVSGMFGEYISAVAPVDTVHNVVLSQVEYERISPVSASAKITLIKVL